LTGSTIYELDKGTGVLLAGSGVVRKPGVTAVDVLTEGKLAVVVTDGKVTGVSPPNPSKTVLKVSRRPP
jgi:hypothetical protein